MQMMLFLIIENTSEEGQKKKNRALNKYRVCGVSASLTTNVYSLLSAAAILGAAITNFSRIISLGNQDMLTFLVDPALCALVLIFSYMGLMSVCLLWLELAFSLTNNKKSIKMIKGCVRVGGMILFLSSSVYSAWAKEMTIIFLAAFLSNILLVIGFWKIPSMLFHSLSIRNPNEKPWPLSRKKRVLPIATNLETSAGPVVGRRSYLWKKPFTQLRTKFSRYRVSPQYNVTIPAEKLRLITDFAKNLNASLLFLCLTVIGYTATYYFPVKAGRVYFVISCLMALVIIKVQFQLLNFIKHAHKA